MPKRLKKAVQKLVINTDEAGELLSALGPGAGYLFVKRFFPDARDSIRITSAYFSLGGFALAQQYVADGVVFRILVGRDDGVDVQQTVLHVVTTELRRPEADFTTAITELVERMQQGRFFIRDAHSISSPFHCKYYICDDHVGWEGSFNFSVNGLQKNAEQGSRLLTLNQVASFINWFENVATESTDLLRPLREQLEQWLYMAPPFDVYLKALNELLAGGQEETRPFAPVYFQQVVIKKSLRQLERFGGAFVVAATGLGKTIIGSEIAMLRQRSGQTNTVILLAPPLVHDKWMEQFQERRIHPYVFSITVPFTKPKGIPHHKISELKHLLEQADSQTLILIDEVHYYRNQQARERIMKESRVFGLLEPAIRQGAQVLLLTATVYGTSIGNLNGLLRLLPHRLQDTFLTQTQGPWTVQSIRDFAELDVVNTLSLPHVMAMARQRGDVDENGRVFIRYAKKQVYLPQRLTLRQISYDLPLVNEVQELFDGGLFSQKELSRVLGEDDETGIIRTNLVDFLYKVALTSWLSSPEALGEVLRHNQNTSDHPEPKKKRKKSAPTLPPEADEEHEELDSGGRYYRSLQWSQNERIRQLGPLAERLSSPEMIDDKFTQLRKIIDQRFFDAGSKILIFIRRYPTALYIQRKLRDFYGSRLAVGCTVGETTKGLAELKNRTQRDTVLAQFSPSSFPKRPRSMSIDILICTDADGLGVDLPEADTVVNYDVPEGADVLFQRAGRILRTTPHSDRHVYFFTFMPTPPSADENDSPCRQKINERFTRLTKRHRHAAGILGSDVMTNETTSDIWMDRTIEDVEGFLKWTALDIHSQATTDHELTLVQYTDRTKKLPGFVHSARYYEALVGRIFLLLRWQGQFYCVLYNLDTNRLESSGERQLLHLIACAPDTPKAFVPVPDVRDWCEKAIKAWCATTPARTMADVEKWCALALVPTPAKPAMVAQRFAKAIQTKKPTVTQETRFDELAVEKP